MLNLIGESGIDRGSIHQTCCMHPGKTNHSPLEIFRHTYYVSSSLIVACESVSKKQKSYKKSNPAVIHKAHLNTSLTKIRLMEFSDLSGEN